MVTISWAWATYWRTMSAIVRTHTWSSVAWLWSWTIEMTMSPVVVLVTPLAAIVLWGCRAVMVTTVVWWRWRCANHEVHVNPLWTAICVES